MTDAWAAMLLSIRSASAVSVEYPRPRSDWRRAVAEGTISMVRTEVSPASGTSGRKIVGRLWSFCADGRRRRDIDLELACHREAQKRRHGVSDLPKRRIHGTG